MTEQPNNPQPTPSGDRRLMRWILVLQVVILGWLAKNHFDGAFHRKRHTQPTVVATQPDTPPSLERSAQPNAPSSFSPAPHFSLLRPFAPMPRHRHLAGSIRAEMLAMMDEANRMFRDMDSFFNADSSTWAGLPASPSMNLRELQDMYELTLAIPNANEQQLDVQLDGRLLSLTAHQDTQTSGASSSQRYTSRVLLPGPVDTNSVMQITNLNDRICIRILKPTTARAAVAPPPAH